jgi:hypothetical protein
VFNPIVEHCFPVEGDVKNSHNSSSSKSEDIFWIPVDFEPNLNRPFDNEENLLHLFDCSEEHSASMYMTRLQHFEDLNHEVPINLVFPGEQDFFI